MRLLEGAVDAEPIDDASDEIHDLAGQVRDLQAQLRDTKRELMQRERETAHALGALRKQLSPLYRALQAVFGELDAVGIEDSPGAAPNPSRTSAVWESWKSRFPGRPAQVIDALLLHGALNQTQIALAVGMTRNNVPQLIFKLNKAGLIDKNGDKYSLKQL